LIENLIEKVTIIWIGIRRPSITIFSKKKIKTTINWVRYLDFNQEAYILLYLLQNLYLRIVMWRKNFFPAGEQYAFVLAAMAANQVL